MAKEKTVKPSRPPRSPHKPRHAPKPRKVTISQLKKKLWKLCRELTIKKYGNTCYTSGQQNLTGANLHCGHFIPSSLCSVAIRYDLRNLRPQSYVENIHHSGNPHEFRRRLIRDNGKKYVDQLEQDNRDTKGKQFDSLWYLSKIEEYKQLL